MGVASELHRAPAAFQLRDIEDLNARLCELRIEATASVLSEHGATVPESAILRSTADEVFTREEEMITEGGSDLRNALRGLLAVSRGATVLPAESNAPDPFDPAVVPSGGPLDPRGGPGRRRHGSSSNGASMDQG